MLWTAGGLALVAGLATGAVMTGGAAGAAEALGISQSAVSQQIAHLERNGYVSVCRDDEDQRARIVALTTKGECAQVVVHRLFAEVEQEWAERIGQDASVALRQALTDLLGEGTAC